MSVKRCKLVLPTSSQKIREAKVQFKRMSKAKKLDLMVSSGAMTKAQAARALKKLGVAAD